MKKAYIIPEISVVSVALSNMIAESMNEVPGSWATSSSCYLTLEQVTLLSDRDSDNY